MRANRKNSIDDAAFGNITEFDAGFIEGVMRSVPFNSRVSMIRERNQKKQLNSSRYWGGKAFGFAAMANLYVVCAYVLYDLLS